jgi:hypothetical protein
MILNKDELSIIQDKHFFDLKQSALQKIESELVALCEDIKNHILDNHFNFPKNTDTELGKISKGENYKGLPYRILDFPRLFKQDGIFTYRVMFWWSKGFYFTFHLSGKHLASYLIKLESQFPKWQQQNVFYYNHTDEWQHEVEMPFYYSIENISFNQLKEVVQKQGYLKIARKLDIYQIEELRKFGLASFNLLFE